MENSASSREEKTFILKEIIQNLQIRNEEKDLYFFSMEILDNESFEKFFQKIMSEFREPKAGVRFVQQ
ncbi:hypothetical protein BLM37_03875 [Candidatus Gracilibacteria bacterium GN02-873]|jgi:hypothetical protein|nr:hypothetical protein BLM37_03875 [Candidatus Gracilibacteria bacterium GN02-873]